MHPHDHVTHVTSYAAMWHYLIVESAINNTVYIRVPRVAFDQGRRWEPWNNTHIPPSRGQPLTVESQVGVSLYRLAHGTSYVTIGHMFSIAKETADKASGCFVNAILKVFSFPSLDKANEWRDIILRCGKVSLKWWGLLMGCTYQSNCHPTTTRSCTLTAKAGHQYYHISVGGAGSMHDSHLFRCSILGQSLRPGACVASMIPWGTFLVGNAGYPTNMNIFLPYPSVVNPGNKRFNYCQSSTCIVVKQAFGRLKNQFCILLHSQNARSSHARNNTIACMILHNFLNHRGLLYLQCWDNFSDQEKSFAKLPVAALDSSANVAELDSATGVSMMTKRNIIRDVLYLP
ncbi:hypothetical protein VP01_2040g3 [Puccinia sorghi]|uniref:DDE Tnp4 domain-containing protein n=1 Tax=Puccinia sorghi TaxID=27349 RepID=A0A0L6VBI9_9BASI|nr:hypothetical protein VP01_2040g3 [Puccinia sorghi]